LVRSQQEFGPQFTIFEIRSSKNRTNLKDVIGKSKEETHMQDNSLYKLGGICSILVGISYAVIGITVLMESPALTVENNAQAPILFFESNRTVLLSQYWAMALGAVFALAVIPAVSEKYDI
jgi:hypothetical protein